MDLADTEALLVAVRQRWLGGRAWRCYQPTSSSTPKLILRRKLDAAA